MVVVRLASRYKNGLPSKKTATHVLLAGDLPSRAPHARAALIFWLLGLICISPPESGRWSGKAESDLYNSPGTLENLV